MMQEVGNEQKVDPLQLVKGLMHTVYLIVLVFSPHFSDSDQEKWHVLLMAFSKEIEYFQ